MRCSFLRSSQTSSSIDDGVDIDPLTGEFSIPIQVSGSVSDETVEGSRRQLTLPFPDFDEMPTGPLEGSLLPRWKTIYLPVDFEGIPETPITVNAAWELHNNILALAQIIEAEQSRDSSDEIYREVVNMWDDEIFEFADGEFFIEVRSDPFAGETQVLVTAQSTRGRWLDTLWRSLVPDGIEMFHPTEDVRMSVFVNSEFGLEGCEELSLRIARRLPQFPAT